MSAVHGRTRSRPRIDDRLLSGHGARQAAAHADHGHRAVRRRAWPRGRLRPARRTGRARRARAERDAQLTVSERLERLHRLCAQLATIAPAPPHRARLMLPDLAGLIGVLAEYRVGYVVIGGVAVAAHGYVRATEDVDVVPDPDRENLDRLGNALVSLDARLTADPAREIGPAERQALYRGRNLTLTTRAGRPRRRPAPPWRAGLRRACRRRRAEHFGRRPAGDRIRGRT